MSLLPNYEQDILKNSSYTRIIGIDEVGRGCWAGPLHVGAFVYESSSPKFKGIDDSKKLSKIKRMSLYPLLSSLKYKVTSATVEEIDKEGIGKALAGLITQLIFEFDDGQTLFLIDGQHARDFGIHSRKFIKGDATYYSIAAASILAKVERDRLMVAMHDIFPQYGFNTNVGYPTKYHRESIAKYGIIELHRKSYEPIKKYL